MGDPRKSKKRYQGPSHPWKKSRLDEERKLISDYGLKNKKEVWKSSSLQRNVANQAKMFIANKGEYAQKLQTQLIRRLHSLNLIPENAQLNDVLSLGVKDFLERRLQTQVYRKGLAKSIKQARQLIVHGHISIGNKKVTVPSYLIKADEEKDLGYSQNSPLANNDHPERTDAKKESEKIDDKKNDKPEKTKVKEEQNSKKEKEKVPKEKKKEEKEKKEPSEEK